MAFHEIAPHSEAWHAARAKNIGGSEIAALFGAQAPYAMTPYVLHQVKSGKVPPPPVDNDRVRWGLALEPVIARMAAERHGWTIRPGRYATDDECPGSATSLDFEIDPPAVMPPQLEGCTGPGCLEAKNVDGMVHRTTWTGDEPPVHQLLQLQDQMACSGYQWGVLCALIGGNRPIDVFYRRRPRIIASIRERVTGFWQAVRENRPPPPDGSDGARAVIQSLFPDLAYEPADLRGDNHLPVLCADLLAARADKKEVDARVAELTNQVMEIMGDHRKAMAHGFNLSIAVSAATEEREPPPGYLIPGRAESRRLIVSERALVA